MELMTNHQMENLRNCLLSNFSYFAQLLTDPEFFDDTFHTDLCNFMQFGGKDKLVVLPRTFLKTTIAATLYALWRATKDPTIRILITSNTDTNAGKTVRTIRGIVEQSEMYRLFFPDRIPEFSKVRWSDSCACLSRKVDYPEGTFESAGVGSNIIRRHFNLIIEDDTVAPKKDELSGEEVMPSRTDIEKAVGFHKLTIPLLINETDERIVIGTRWASYDLINYVKENEQFSVYDRKCRDANGQPVYKKFSQNRLDDIKRGMGIFMFSMLYENNPLAKEFMAFNPDWFQYYNGMGEVDEVEGEIAVNVDPADPPTGKKSQDYSAIVGTKDTKQGLYVLRYVRKRLSDRQLIKSTFDLAEELHASKIRVEVNRYAHLGTAFREEMKSRNTFYIIEEIKSKGKKEARIKGRLSPLYEAHLIFHTRGMGELEEELTTFPYGKHDDLIDALSFGVKDRMAKNYDKQETTVKQENPYSSHSFEQIRDSFKSAINKRSHLCPFASLGRGRGWLN